MMASNVCIISRQVKNKSRKYFITKLLWDPNPFPSARLLSVFYTDTNIDNSRSACGAVNVTSGQDSETHMVYTMENLFPPNLLREKKERVNSPQVYPQQTQYVELMLV